MRSITEKSMAVLCAAAIALGLVPVPALAAVLEPAFVDLSASRADLIDALPEEACSQDSIIVVYREDAQATRKAERGATEMTVRSIDDAKAKAEVLCADAGADGAGAAVAVAVPEGMTVGQAVESAEKAPDVLYAQPNFSYYLLDDLGQTAPVEQAAEAVSGTLASAVAVAQGQAGEGESTAVALPNDPYVGVSENDTRDYPINPNQWWIHAVGAPAAWQRVKGQDNPCTVAVLDTGIDFDHEDLKANVWADYAYDSYLDRKMDPERDGIDDEEMQHGCHVAGIIAAEADNGKGIAGISYNGKVLPIRVFHIGSSGRATCSDEDLIRAYEYLMSDADGNGKTVAQETNTHVVNMSLGGYLQDEADWQMAEDGMVHDPMEFYDYAFEDIIEKAQDEANILSVAAAGNGDSSYNGRTDASYPSDFDAVMGVMALKTATAHTRWSDYNEHKNISAPGNNIFSTYWTADSAESFNGTKYAFESGTSMATPLVAGCASLLWSYDPNMSVQDVKDAIYGTAVPLSGDAASKFGHGRIDIAAAVSSLGTANVKCEAATMMRTDTQVLSAVGIADPSAAHEWDWSVAERAAGSSGDVEIATDKATIGADGKLTALKAGNVVVTATAKDDSSIVGKRTIAITEIEIPGGIAASANPSESTIALRWSATRAAKKYRVERAGEGVDSETPGDFREIAVVDAADVTFSSVGEDGKPVSSARFLDATKSEANPDGVEVGVLYWYRVTPIGMLASEEVEGVTTPMSGRCFFTDKRALKAGIQKAEGLLGTTETSVDGSDVSTKGFWTTSGERRTLRNAMIQASNAYTDGSMLQAGVDASAVKLDSANSVFEAVRKAGTRADAVDDVKPEKLANTMTVSRAKTASVKAKSLKKKAKKLAISKFIKVREAQGEVTYAKVGKSKLSLARSGKVTVPKRLKRGTYLLKLKVNASGDSSHLAMSVPVTVRVRVK